MTSQNSPLIEIKGIRKIYRMGDTDLEVLRGVDLRVEQGEFLAIMGPSGSGKSTLMHILGMLDKPSAGQYFLGGRDVLALSEAQTAQMRSRTIGFVFQQFNLMARMSALDNVALPLIYSRADARQEKAAKHLKEVGLENRMDHRPGQLSGGQQQRVAIARALVNSPSIIFADEPTGNLASAQADEIMEILKGLNESGITVVIVTHEPDIAAWAKRVIHIKDGLVVSDTAPQSAPAAHTVRPHVKDAPVFTLAEMKEHFISAVNAMLSNKVRTALTMLGIIIGVASIIAMMAIGKGAQKSIEQRLSSLGANLIMVMPASRSSHGVSGAMGDVSRLTIEDSKLLAENSSLISRVDPTVSGSAQVVYGANNTNTSITGASVNYAPMHNAVPKYGRFFTEAEDNSLAKVAVIGQTVANNLFGAEDPVGKVIKISRKNFRVVGVLPIKGASFRDQDDIVIIPLNTAMKRALGKKYLNQIYVESKSSDLVSKTQDYVEAFFRKRHRLAEDKDNDFEVMNMSEIQSAMSSTTQAMSLLLGIIAGISLLVGGIGIMNIMLVSVSERTREIGLRKAIGATRVAVLTQFLIEASALSLSGGAIGIALGVSSALLLAKIAKWAIVVSSTSIILAVAFSASVGIIFGFWPAKKASELSPIEALRYE